MSAAAVATTTINITYKPDPTDSSKDKQYNGVVVEGVIDEANVARALRKLGCRAYTFKTNDAPGTGTQRLKLEVIPSATSSSSTNYTLTVEPTTVAVGGGKKKKGTKKGSKSKKGTKKQTGGKKKKGTKKGSKSKKGTKKGSKSKKGTKKQTGGKKKKGTKKQTKKGSKKSKKD
jgi:hypothetical protein